MSYSGKQIYVIGPGRMFNQLMALYLAEKTGASCFIDTRLANVPVKPGNGGAKRLILYAFESGHDQLEILLDAHVISLLETDHLVLFNLKSPWGIEHEALKLGVHGFLYQQDGTDTLMKMIHAVFNSELWISRSVITEYLLNNNNGHTVKPAKNAQLCLTKREVEILNMISLGHSNSMIADKHCISPHTVKTHVYHLFKKINVSSRIQAANWASRNL